MPCSARRIFQGGVLHRISSRGSSLTVVAADERALVIGLLAFRVGRRMIAMRLEGSLAAELGR